MSALETFLELTPKVELHLHLVGSASPATVSELASRSPDVGVPADPDALRDFYRFRDFPHFIDVYTIVTSLVRTGDDVATLVAGAARDLTVQGVRYAEMTVTPYMHTIRGLDYHDVLEVCPSSNVCTRVFDSLADHSIGRLLDAGAFITVNTDDPPMFNTTLTDEYRRLAARFSLDVDAIATLVANGVRASFLPDDRKASLLADIDNALATATGIS